MKDHVWRALILIAICWTAYEVRMTRNSMPGDSFYMLKRLETEVEAIRKAMKAELPQPKCPNYLENCK